LLQQLWKALADHYSYLSELYVSEFSSSRIIPLPLGIRSAYYFRIKCFNNEAFGMMNLSFISRRSNINKARVVAF
jgi:hypothetical protein